MGDMNQDPSAEKASLVEQQSVGERMRIRTEVINALSEQCEKTPRWGV